MHTIGLGDLLETTDFPEDTEIYVTSMSDAGKAKLLFKGKPSDINDRYKCLLVRRITLYKNYLSIYTNEFTPVNLRNLG